MRRRKSTFPGSNRDPIRDPIGRWARATILASMLVAIATPASSEARVRLCLLPLAVPFAQDDPRATRLEARIARRFEEGGFAVTRSADTTPVVEAVEERWGAIFDPAFGHVVETALATHHRELGRAMQGELGCQALVRVHVHVLRAAYVGGSARWDGVVVSINSPARQWFVGDERGWVSALSLWVELFDLEGESLAFRSAGIEPLISFSLKRDVDRLPEDRWLHDEAVVDRAIDSALGPMALDVRERGFPTARPPRWPFEWPVAP